MPLIRAWLDRLRPPVRARELCYFLSQLSLMLEVGTPLSSAMAAVASQTENPRFRAVIEQMLSDIEEGRQLSDAMGRHPRVFDPIFASLVRAGETGGFLKMTIDRTVGMMEKQQALVTQLRSALTYPFVLCLAALVVVVFVLVAVLPRFMVFFEGKESLLPLTTRALMAMSRSLTGYWWGHLAVAGAAVMGCTAFLRSGPGTRLLERFLLHVPPFARLTRKIYAAQLFRTLGHLAESSIPLLDALAATRATMRSHAYRVFIDSVAAQIQQGARFASAFSSFPYIAPAVKQMIATGEESGNLERVMLRLAEFYETEVDQELKTVAALVEPLALVVLGVVVGIIVSAIILPLFKLAHALH